MIANDVNKVLLALIMGAMIGSDLGGQLTRHHGWQEMCY